jgi:hypothetical protein
MNDHLEDTLRRELREVADRLSVPPQPALPETPARPVRHWRPLLVAAVVTLIVGAVAAVAVYGGGRSMQPAEPPTPTSGSVAVRPLTADVPTVPFRFGDSLMVGGRPVSRGWANVKQAGGVWVGQRFDDTWWWGTGAEPQPIDDGVILQPHLSPDGSRLAFATTERGGRLSLIDTRTGDLINDLWSELNGFGVTAVTNDGRVILSNGGKELLWLAATGDETVGRQVTVPGQSVLGSTSAGLIVQEDGGEVFLGTIDDSGVITRLSTLPSDQVVVNPSGSWLAYGGSWGGESTTIPYVTAQPLDGSRKLEFRTPGRGELLALTWESDDLLLAEIHIEGDQAAMARCSVREERCLRLDE